MSDDLRVVVLGDPAVVLDMSRIEGDFIDEMSLHLFLITTLMKDLKIFLALTTS